MTSRQQHREFVDDSPDTVASPVKDISLDTIYDILRNKRRRLVLHYLVNDPAHQAVLGTLATQIAAWENDIPVAAVTAKLRKRTYNTLQQAHLPKMDDAGLIAYDHNRGTIQLTVDPSQLEFFLDILPKTGTLRVNSLLLLGFVTWFALAANWAAVHVFSLYDHESTILLTGLALAIVFLGLVYISRLFW